MNHRLNFLIVIGVGLVLTSCSKHEATPSSKGRVELPVVKATVSPVVAENLPTQVEVTGAVRAVDRASIAPKVMGSISSFPVKLSQRVEKGELLVKIDAAEIGAKVSQAQTQLSQAKRDLLREQSLLEKDASTSEMVKNLKDRVDLSEAMVTEALAMLSYTEIRAPFAGSISRIYADEGSLASPGIPLLELEGNTGFEIEAAVPESLMVGQKIGARFQASLPPSASSFEVVVTEVSPGSDNQSRSVTVRYALPSEVEARVGQFARITLEAANRSKILVSGQAVSKLGQMERVFVAENGRASLRLVKTGAISGQLVEIVSGLDADERVVVEATQPLLDGQPLEVTR